MIRLRLFDLKQNESDEKTEINTLAVLRIIKFECGLKKRPKRLCRVF